jgi:hypothetical protein
MINLSDCTVMVNNEVIPIIPNSLKFNEGLGEQSIRAASGGGGNVVQVYSNNIESNFAMVSFDIPSTIETVAKAREWKTNKNANLVQISARTSEGKFTRTFTQAALLNNYEVALGSDANIAIEFKSNPAI